MIRWDQDFETYAWMAVIAEDLSNNIQTMTGGWRVHPPSLEALPGYCIEKRKSTRGASGIYTEPRGTKLC